MTEIEIDPADFSELSLRPELLDALGALGYEEPTPIQREAIPPLLEGRDLLGQAATGTGKTAAFALPILQNMPEPGSGTKPVALVLAPTRELAVQTSEAIHRYGRALGVRVLPVYGGAPIGRQIRTLKAGADVVVATPGRALDLINRGTLVLDDVDTVVLDEADEMLDMGFAEDIEAILGETPEDRQTVLFSATMPSRIDGIARRHLHDPVRIQIERETVPAGEVPLVRQTAYVVARAHKAAALGRILDVEAPTAAIVFCRTRDEVDQLTETMNGRGYRAEALHGGMSQEQRDRVMDRLRSGSAELLVATDVAARGLDVAQLTHVVNYDVPSAPESYVHRIGRVGRAGREGVAVTLAEPREHRMLKTIERVTRQRIVVEKLPTVADLRARRLELTRSAIQERIESNDLDRYRVLVETLADEYDVMEVALAAVKLAYESSGPEADEEEIPEVTPRERRPRREFAGERRTYGDSGDRRGRGDRGDRGRWDRGRGERGERGERGDRGDRAGRGDRGARGDRGDMTRLFVNAGRNSGIRPGDLVGAIAGETNVRGNQIGSIEIADRFSLVEVPSSAVNEVIDALRGTTIRGQRVNARRERY